MSYHFDYFETNPFVVRVIMNSVVHFWCKIRALKDERILTIQKISIPFHMVNPHWHTEWFKRRTLILFSSLFPFPLSFSLQALCCKMAALLCHQRAVIEFVLNSWIYSLILSIIIFLLYFTNFDIKNSENYFHFLLCGQIFGEIF